MQEKTPATKWQPVLIYDGGIDGGIEVGKLRALPGRRYPNERAALDAALAALASGKHRKAIGATVKRA